MTTRRVSLEIVVDDADERLCGKECPGYGDDTEDDCTVFHADHDFYTPEGRAFRATACLSAEALAAADDAVLDAADRVPDDEESAAPLLAAIDARRKLRTPKGTG